MPPEVAMYRLAVVNLVVVIGLLISIAIDTYRAIWPSTDVATPPVNTDIALVAAR